MKEKEAMKKLKINKKKGILLSVGVMLLIAAGIILWPFVSPIRVTWSSLPYVYTIHGTYIEINIYTGDEENVVIPEKICFRPVKVLGEQSEYAFYGAFWKNEKIKQIYIPDGVEVIEAHSFAYCRNLEKVHLPENLKVLKEQTFDTCTSLKDIKIPERVERIGGGCFFLCSKLEEVELPTSLLKLGDRVFFGCEKLDNIEIPEGVEEIGGRAFKETIWLEKQNGEFVVAGKNVLVHYNGADATVEVPEGIEYIGEDLFYEREEITQLILPKSLKKCDGYMIDNCDNLKYIVVKNPNMIFEYVNEYSDLVQEGITLISEKGSSAEALAEQYNCSFAESIPEE